MTMRALVALAFLLAVTSAPPGLAQVPLGPEFRVSTHAPTVGGPTHTSETPRGAAMTPDGRFVVAWGGYRLSSPPPFASDIAVRRFGASGRARAMDAGANTFTAGRLDNEAIGIDDAGNFVVVWNSEGQDGSGLGVFGRRFAASGAAVGAEFRVNETTAGDQAQPALAMAPDGGFVVAWRDGGIRARRYDAAGAPMGIEFQVNTSTASSIGEPTVATDGAGNFVVVYSSFDLPTGPAMYGQLYTSVGTPIGAEFVVAATHPGGQPAVARRRDGAFVVTWTSGGVEDPSVGVFARRFDAAGAPIGADFLVNVATTGRQDHPDVTIDADGDFVVVWADIGVGGGDTGVVGRRFDGSGNGGAPFRVDSVAHSTQPAPSVAGDQAGNFVVTWYAFAPPTGSSIFGRRYAAGLLGTAMTVDPSPGPGSDGNRVLEAGETVTVLPSWLNANTAAQTFAGAATTFTGPGSATYTIADGAASYGTVPASGTASCADASDCYDVTVTGARPAPHWDAMLREEMAPAGLGGQRLWPVHVGGTFADVLPTSPFYRFIEALVHHGVTAGCTSADYCPVSSTTREQMAVFVLIAKEGGWQPPSCSPLLPRTFADVPASSVFCPWIEELARRGVVGGCDATNYCPQSLLSREQMAVFALRTLDPALSPPACATPMFADVPPTSPFCRWIEELARRGVVSGCGGGNYCPVHAVTREQMGVFLSGTFGLPLYGP